jgi:hypothetical protein
MFRCEWAKMTIVRVDNFGITEINFNNLSQGSEITYEPFILASQATQVYIYNIN